MHLHAATVSKEVAATEGLPPPLVISEEAKLKAVLYLWNHRYPKPVA